MDPCTYKQTIAGHFYGKAFCIDETYKYCLEVALCLRKTALGMHWDRLSIYHLLIPIYF